MTIASRTAHTISALVLLVPAALSAASIAAAEPTDPGTWPVAQGNFTTPGEPGWVFFETQGIRRQRPGTGSMERSAATSSRHGGRTDLGKPGGPAGTVRLLQL